VNFDAAPVLVDAVPQERTNMVTGANRDGSTWVASMSRATCCPQRRRGWQISAPAAGRSPHRHSRWHVSRDRGRAPDGGGRRAAPRCRRHHLAVGTAPFGATVLTLGGERWTSCLSASWRSACA